MKFLMEWFLAWHRAVWFPFLYFSELEAEPVEFALFDLGEDAVAWTRHENEPDGSSSSPALLDVKRAA